MLGKRERFRPLSTCPKQCGQRLGLEASHAQPSKCRLLVRVTRTPCRTICNSLNYMINSRVDRPPLAGTLWSPAPDSPPAWTTRRDKPVPYDRCSLHVRGPAPGWTLSSNRSLASLASVRPFASASLAIASIAEARPSHATPRSRSYCSADSIPVIPRPFPVTRTGARCASSSNCLKRFLAWRWLTGRAGSHDTGFQM